MKFKQFYLFLMFFVSAFILFGCDTVVDPDIETPTNVAIQDGVVTWNAISDIDGYIVVVGTTNHNVETNSFDLKTLSLQAGTYQVYVIAVLGSKVSANSLAVSFVVAEEQIVLTTPTNLVISDGILTWNAVDQAISYIVTVNSVEYPVTVRSFNLDNLFLPDGEYQVTVKAVKGSVVSSPATIGYNVVPLANKNNIYTAVLLAFNSDYQPNMTKDDFEKDYEFEDYLMFSELLDAYSQAAVNARLTETSAIGIFEHLMGLPGRLENLMSAQGLKDEIDSYGQFGISTAQFSFVMTELSLTASEISEVMLNKNKERYEEEVLDHLLSITYIKDGGEFQQLISKLTTYSTTYEMETIYHILYEDRGDRLYSMLNYVDYMASDLYNDFYGNQWYLYSEDSFLIYNILSNAKLAGDNDFLLAISSNSWLYFAPFYNLRNIYNNLHYVNDDIERTEMQLDIVIKMRELVTEEKEFFRDSLNQVADYYSSFYQSIPLSLITMIDDLISSGEITTAEYFILKDEIVNILLDTLPPASFTTNMYLTFLHVGSVFDDYDVDDYQTLATELGKINHIVSELMLLMFLEIDEQMLDDLFLITDGLYQPGYEEYDYVDKYYYYVDPVYDFEKIIELILYVGNFLKDFEETNQSKFDDLNDIGYDIVLQQLSELFARIAKNQLKDQLSQDEYDLVVILIDEAVADLPNIIAGLDVINGIGKNLLVHFIETEAIFFTNLIELINSDIEFGSEIGFFTSIHELFGDFVGYNSLLFDLDQVAIEKLLKATRIPVIFTMTTNHVMDMEDINELYNDLVTPVATVIFNILTIEKQFVDVVKDIDLDEINNLQLTDYEKHLVLMIKVLDGALTSSVRQLIYQTIDIIADDIMKHDIIQENGPTEAEVDDMLIMVKDMLDDMLDELDVISNYDFNDLDQEKLDRIYDFFDFQNGGSEEPIAA